MKHLNIEERMLIRACLSKNTTITEIAKRLNRNKSTISREISSHLTSKEGITNKDCIHRNKHTLCNSCRYQSVCLHERHYYNFEEVDYISKDLRSSSRQYTKLTKEQLALIDDILIEQVRNLKQSLHHTYISNPSLSKICSEKQLDA